MVTVKIEGFLISRVCLDFKQYNYEELTMALHKKVVQTTLDRPLQNLIYLIMIHSVWMYANGSCCCKLTHRLLE